jgi:hypothetical protein
MNTIAVGSTFEFLNEDVKRQLEISKRLLEQARSIEEELERLSKASGDPTLIEKLSRTRDDLLRSAKELANNANFTSTSAMSSIADVTFRST